MSSMDREIPLEQRQRTHRGRLLRVGLGALLAILLVLGLRQLATPTVALADLRISTVQRARIEATLSASGLVKAEFEELLASPSDSRILKVHAHPGALLAAGDTLMQLDTREIRLELDRLADQIALTQAQLRQQSSEQERVQGDLRSERGILEEKIRYLEARRQQEEELYKRQLTTVWSLRQAERDENIAHLELQGLDERIRHLKEGALAGNETLEIQIRLYRQDQQRAQEALSSACLVAPRECVLSWAVEQEGQAVSKGTPLARLANRDSWKVEASLSDVHAARLQVGQECRIGLNERQLVGHVDRVHPQIENGQVLFDVRLDDPRDPELHSNLRVDVDVIRESHDNALIVRRGPGTDGAGTRPTLFVVNGDHLERRDVICGLSNRDEVEVLQGVQEGERVVISGMNDWLHLETLTLK